MVVGVVGAGSMGAGIAQVAATAGCEVLLYDMSIDVTEKALIRLNKILDRLVEKGRINREKSNTIISNISLINEIEKFKDANLVIEAIVENLEIKKEVFSHIEKVVPKDCVIATNTSSLSVTNLASSCKSPNRFIGIHFFNPAPLMPLVEIIPALQTEKKIIQEVQLLIKDWGKTTVLTKDTPGFIVNRIARPYYGEALRIYDEGLANFNDIDVAMKEIGGFRMGPFELMDFIGNDVNYAVTETVFKSFFYDPRYKPSFTQKQHAEAGWLGKKSGKGYYNYNDGKIASSPSNLDEPHLNKIFTRILVMLINEAADALYLNIASKDDIELAMKKGVNYPKGLLAWADKFGIENCVAELDKLYDLYHEDRYRASVLLRKMAKSKSRFF
ncbi:MAG: 3-hydroxybutyryl-CoA dehydrogenase [Crocinitomicaceae bacterium]|nr:3-hydroxybutyryl-CoA dehydrogenase [Crocinitomicaceae bacterium]